MDVRLRDVRCRAGVRAEIRGVHLEVLAGERVALTGAAAAPARTALLRAVAGLHQVSGGQITVGGRENRNPAERAWRNRACAWLPRVTVAPGSMARAGTMPWRDAGTTRGELQFLSMARAIGCVTAGAGVLLADHPTEGLEGADRNALAQLLAESPVTVLVATDDPVLVSLCDRSVDLAPAVRHEEAGPTSAWPPGASGSVNSPRRAAR
ncbi:hypothetical protein BEK98_25255 [Streptomyces diastatochromogenes]|uniref:ABC transporter domain-containing protein n=1 Tax=Streptomyces diastatochromogenes TaxID=42236 RepID=A0A233SB68_STRDA|nr:hypothetical protein BEK98_25255 [Streptomyces diastatochromogenes]